MTRRVQIGLLLAITAVVTLVQIVTISRAAVPALDAVRFVNSAKMIDELGFLGFLGEQTEQPLFPLFVWGSHRLLVSLLGDFRQSWAASVQVAAALPLVALPLPVFCLARRLIGPLPAILGTMLLVSLPEMIRLGADGISDSTHLLWFTVALALLVQHLQTVHPWSKKAVTGLLAGLATGLALLTRIEVVVLAAAFVVVLLSKAVRRRESPWLSAFAYVGGLALVLVPYALLLIQAERVAVASTDPAVDQVPGYESAMDETFSFAPKDPTTSIRKRGAPAAAVQLTDELAKAFAYLPGMVALFGFWCLRRRKSTDADLLLQAFCVLLLAAVFVHTAREGYLAARHLLPLVVASTGCLGVGVVALAEGLGVLFRSSFQTRGVTNPVCHGPLVGRVLRHLSTLHAREAAAPRSTETACGPMDLRGTALATTATLAIALICTAYGARPLHSSRTGHRAAASWLARHADCGDRVVDTRGWTGLYSGLETILYEDSRSELLRPQLRYVVIENGELAFGSARSRTIEALLKRAATPVASFSHEGVSDASAAVLVYRWNLEGQREKSFLAGE